MANYGKSKTGFYKYDLERLRDPEFNFRKAFKDPEEEKYLPVAVARLSPNLVLSWDIGPGDGHVGVTLIETHPDGTMSILGTISASATEPPVERVDRGCPKRVGCKHCEAVREGEEE